MDRKHFWFLLMIMGLILAACAPKTTGLPTLEEAAPIPKPTAPSTIPRFALVPPEAEPLCETAFSSPVTAGSVMIPLRTLVIKEYEGEGWVYDPNIMIVPHKEPLNASEIHTLVCIRESRVQEVTYPDGEVGYRVVWDARLVLYPEGGVVGAQKFEGGPPPSAEIWELRKKYEPPPAYGESPEGSLLEWLFPFLGDRMVFCTGSSVYDIALSPDGGTLAAGGSSNTVKLWDMATGEPLRTLTLGEDVVYVDFLAFSPDGKTLALPAGEYVFPIFQPIRLWDVASGEVMLSFSTDEYLSVHSVVFSPDGKMLASGNWDGAVHLWDVASGQVLRTLTAHTDFVSSVAFSPDGKILASGSLDGTVVLWDVATGQTRHSLSAHTDSVESVAFSPDGKTLASGGDDNTVILWDVATGQMLYTLSGEDLVTSVAFSPDGKILASGEPSVVRLWDVTTGELLRVLEGHTKSVRNVVFLPDGKSLASGSIDTTIKLWDVATGQ